MAAACLPSKTGKHFSKGQLLILGTDTRLPKLSPTQSEPRGTELVADIKIPIFSALQEHESREHSKSKWLWFWQMRNRTGFETIHQMS